ncbi:hypothetical protein [Neobacillus ginsengisoli]|uniref:Uncharacterized protein n=1 Tax=Neobacillus ginsengisoli TaxID=904295 RepID=A0ABT9XXA2_9BACI|nr:hypothetical protein [Neobacillus ginsengisoli]MDQ0199559.1 hypothetical protein [Neobacillus ginsengisoli]
MIYQHLLSDEPIQGMLYNFMEFKKKKPFFKNPIKITIGNPLNDTYYMLKNIVYNEKQILALKKEQDSNMIVLVEAKIEDGQLIKISRLPDDFIGGISWMFEGMLNAN